MKILQSVLSGKLHSLFLRCDRVIMTRSAMQLIDTSQERIQELLQYLSTRVVRHERPILIMFEESIPYNPILNQTIDIIVSERDDQGQNIMTQFRHDGMILDRIIQNQDDPRTWRPAPDHPCKACAPGKVCHFCEPRLAMMVARFLSCILIHDRYLAEDVYEERNIKVRVAKKNTNPKTKPGHANYLFHVIDASKRVIPITVPSQTPTQGRGSWLALHQENEIMYVERRVERKYHHERYKNVRGQTHSVKQRIPVLKENEERRVSKVIASAFE